MNAQVRVRPAASSPPRGRDGGVEHGGAAAPDAGHRDGSGAREVQRRQGAFHLGGRHPRPVGRRPRPWSRRTATAHCPRPLPTATRCGAGVPCGQCSARCVIQRSRAARHGTRMPHLGSASPAVPSTATGICHCHCMPLRTGTASRRARTAPSRQGRSARRPSGRTVPRVAPHLLTPRLPPPAIACLVNRPPGDGGAARDAFLAVRRRHLGGPSTPPLPRATDGGNKDGSAHHWAASVALWRPDCETGIGPGGRFLITNICCLLWHAAPRPTLPWQLRSTLERSSKGANFASRAMLVNTARASVKHRAVFWVCVPPLLQAIRVKHRSWGVAVYAQAESARTFEKRTGKSLEWSGPSQSAAGQQQHPDVCVPVVCASEHS